MNILVKALKQLETKGRCELMEFDDNQGVKFFWAFYEIVDSA